MARKAATASPLPVRLRARLSEQTRRLVATAMADQSHHPHEGAPAALRSALAPARSGLGVGDGGGGRQLGWPYHWPLHQALRSSMAASCACRISTAPPRMSPHEEVTGAVNRPMMGVFNNLVIYDQHVAQ